MAIKRLVNFRIGCLGDGSSDETEFVMAASPFWFEPPNVGELQLTFDLLAMKPSDVIDVTANQSITVTAASITTLGTKLKVEFDAPPANNLQFVIVGVFVFG